MLRDLQGMLPIWLEEADTQVFLHAIDAKSQGATYISIHSQDTNVLVLSI